ncbi:MAG: lipase maturation factor family protein [Elusimicrobia bacterium]|nr:lipase maturation factor family protein [Elusimicrobiota bacterium]
METYFGDFRLANLLFQRSLAAVYLIAFAAALNQFPVLLGEHGFLPVPAFVRDVPFWRAPGLFHFFYSDRLFSFSAWAGLLLSALLVLGLLEKSAWWLTAAAWLALYFLYLSIVNVGQTFYAFGWESMLLEAGFLAAFLGPAAMKPSLVPVLALRWMLFRLILGAGLIKLRNDPCWRDLTCLAYHFETQPQPNPLSWYFHRLPAPVLAGGVLLNHVVEIIAPFGFLGPQPAAAAAAALLIAHQALLIASGNFSFLNFLTIVLCLTAVSDSVFGWFCPAAAPPAPPAAAPFRQYLLYALGAGVVLLSVRPALNLFSGEQVMNASYNQFHLVNTYGMFGTITKERYEIVIEGTSDAEPGPGAEWKEYEFKGKPGDVKAPPPQVAPYHLRLDWLMWFLPFSVGVAEKGIIVYGYERWFISFMKKLLEGDPATLKLLKPGPFSRPPRYVRARFYRYRFSGPEERKNTGAWWKRELAGEYLPPVDLRALKEAEL